VAGAFADGAADADGEATGAAAARLVAAVGTGARDPGAAAGDCVHPRAPETRIETTIAEAHAFEMRQPIGGNSVRLLLLKHFITADFSADSSRSQSPIATSKVFLGGYVRSTKSAARISCAAESHHPNQESVAITLTNGRSSDPSFGAHCDESPATPTLVRTLAIGALPQYFSANPFVEVGYLERVLDFEEHGNR